MHNNKFIFTNQFDKVFESYDLQNYTAILKDSELYDNNSLIFIVDPSLGNWIYVQGHLFNGSNQMQLATAEDINNMFPENSSDNING